MLKDNQILLIKQHKPIENLFKGSKHINEYA